MIIIVIIIVVLIWRYLDFIQSSPRILHPAHFSFVSNIVITVDIVISIIVVVIIIIINVIIVIIISISSLPMLCLHNISNLLFVF